MAYPEEVQSLISLAILTRFFEDRKFRAELKALTGYRPSNLRYYRQAFTHKSAILEKGQKLESNERLEFLGDAVLSLVIGAYLYNKYPDQNEGYLSQLRSRVVNRELFNALGMKMGLDEWMDKVAPYAADINHAPDLLGNAFEALVGAIYLDKGYEAARRFFEKTVLVHHLDIEEVRSSDTNYKSRLLEWGQKNNRKIEFLLVNVNRESQKLQFEIQALVDGELSGTGLAAKKKKAEQLAAKEALRLLKLDQ